MLVAIRYTNLNSKSRSSFILNVPTVDDAEAAAHAYLGKDLAGRGGKRSIRIDEIVEVRS